MEQLFLLILLLIVVLFVKFKHTFKASKKSSANDTAAINVFYLKQSLLTPADFPESILTDKERELLGLNADRKQL